MLESILIIVIIVAIFVAIYRMIAASHKPDKFTIILPKPNINIPHPELTNDYRFYKAIEQISQEYLQQRLGQILKGAYVKPEFEKAIREKILSGKFKNPIKFRDYYGTHFDMIGIHFVKDNDDELSTFMMTAYYIQRAQIADSENYVFKPDDKYLKDKAFKSTMQQLNIDPNTLTSFKDVWNKFDLKDYFNHNLLVVWDDDAETFEDVLKRNHISDYSIQLIKIREISQSKNLPDTFEGLLKHKPSDFTNTTDQALVCASMAKDFKDSGVELSNFIHTIRFKSGE